MSSSEIRKFKITGEIKKGKTRIPFVVNYDAVKQEHATQRLYSEMGSRHHARRFEITIKSIREIEKEVGADVAAADK